MPRFFFVEPANSSKRRLSAASREKMPASRIPDDVRKAHPSMTWQLAADMRNKPIRGYDVIEHAIVYDTVKDDLPVLVQQLDEILP